MPIFQTEPREIDLSFAKEAIELAQHARSAGDHPFGALLVLDGSVVLRARNTVATDRDPTAHAESNLIAAAIRKLTPDERRRSVLYTSCEPCAMCAGTMYWAGIRSVVFALSAEELARLAGRDFLMPCAELFARATEPVHIIGPLPMAEARDVHVGFWPPPPTSERRSPPIPARSTRKDAIRTATTRDVADLQILFGHLTGSEADRRVVEDRLRMVAASAIDELYVLEDDRGVQGLLGFRIRENVEDASRFGEVTAIAVHPSARRKGHGRVLMAFAEDLARRRGCKGTWLVSGYGRDHEAHAFYRQLGYQDTGYRFVKPIEPVG